MCDDPAHPSDSCFQPGPICDVSIIFFFLPLLAQAASGEVARRHVSPCAHYTCINSIRKSSGQTFQSSAFNSSLGRLYWQREDFQGVWTCAVLFIDSHHSPSYKPQECGCAAFEPILLRVLKFPSAAHKQTCTHRALQ